MYLDALPLLEAHVGYGELGMHGSLGYEDKTVSVRRQPYPHALSTHPPAHVHFQVDRRFASFSCQVALNDDVREEVSYAHFSVMADGHEVAVEPYVRAGESPRTLRANITGAAELELRVRTNRWEYCHAVWLDPQVSETPLAGSKLLDCLGRVEIVAPAVLPQAKRCIATVVSPGFEHLLDDLLGSLYANGGCQDALLVVLVVDGNSACEQVARKYQATVIRCRSHARVNATTKAALYSIARVVNAERFLCLDADMLVLGDLRPVFHALDACPDGTILACREGNGRGWHQFDTLGHALCTVYGGREADLTLLLGTPDGEAVYSLVVNDGLFAGGRAALLSLDGFLRGLPHAARWTDERRDIWWRNQFLFNLALARLRCGVELDASYNLQLNSHEVEFSSQEGRVQARWDDRPVRVLHFNGLGRHKYPEWRNLFAQVSDPLVGRGGEDSYEHFLTALRAWVGRHGLTSLAWSFYGTTDAQAAIVRDPTTLPLFALFHYLVRANGCVRVLETGTARGVSAACLASAVAHRPDGCVVTLDIQPYLERETLWALLPETIRSRIDARVVDALTGMTAALESGERYDAVLLDSLHTEEHVWAEFQLATQLVCPGGLILIHDATYKGGTVDDALRRIEAAGYGVVRLWTAEGGIAEDDHLGLALIENRCRQQSAVHLSVVDTPTVFAIPPSSTS